MDIPDSISRAVLWDYVFDKCKNRNIKISRKHIYSVIVILLEEIVKDLNKRKAIEIFNFGKLFLNVTKTRQGYHKTYKKIVKYSGYKSLKFSLIDDFRKILHDLIDYDKTFNIK